YLSAFFESVFHGEFAYEKLFENHYYGKEWLPSTTFVSKYRDTMYQSIKQFHKGKLDSEDLEGFSRWEVTTPIERGGGKHLQDALLLEWKKDATYTLDLSEETLNTNGYSNRERLVF